MMTVEIVRDATMDLKSASPSALLTLVLVGPPALLSTIKKIAGALHQ
jgi:hypothetical protein